MKCKNHPKYKGIFKPTSNCPICLDIYNSMRVDILHGLEDKVSPDYVNLKSRSVQRRIAAQKGLPAPTFIGQEPDTVEVPPDKLPPYPKSREIWAYRILLPMCQDCKKLNNRQAIFTTVIDNLTHFSEMRDGKAICQQTVLENIN